METFDPEEDRSDQTSEDEEESSGTEEDESEEENLVEDGPLGDGLEFPEDDREEMEEIPNQEESGIPPQIGPKLPSKRQEHRIPESMPKIIQEILSHSWTGAEYTFQVRWNNGTIEDVPQKKLTEGTIQERQVLKVYIRKNPGLASSLSGRVL